jgi:phage baseplate assembly protein W
VSEIDFPYHVGDHGRTASTSEDDHIHDLVEQLVFTAPGERPNRPTLGSGLMRLVHEPARGELATATQMLVQGALQQWLGDVIQVQSVDVASEESLVVVTVSYLVRRSGELRTDVFRQAAP